MKKSVNFSVSLCVLSVVVSIIAKEVSASPLDEFIRETSRVKQRIVNEMDSFLIKCERLPSEDVLLTLSSGGDIPLSWELGWKGKIIYAKRTFFPTEAQKKVETVTIPEEPTTLILKKGALLEWPEGYNRCYVNSFDDVDINMINEWPLFEFLGYNVAEKIFSSADISYADF